MSFADILFVALHEKHMPLMHAWLNSGEALRWYGSNPQSEEQLRQKYLTSRSVRSYIVELGEQEPVGYLQYYRIADHPDYCREVDGLTGDYGMDLFIGRDELIGRGLGGRIVHMALRQLVFAQPDAQRCLIGPAPENHRAIRCYEKCGFIYHRTVRTPSGEEYLMVYEPGGE